MKTAATATSPAAVKPRILICDDDFEFAQEMIEALGARDFPAKHMLTISAARAAILGPCVLILDLCMPERSGLDIAKLLSTHAHKNSFQIVLVTGCSQQLIDLMTQRFRDYDLHVVGALQKPVDMKKLCALLETVC